MIMERAEIELAGKVCRIYGEKNAQFLLIQPVDDHDLSEMDQETEEIAARTGVPFLLAAVPVTDWNDDLSPWSAPAVFGNHPFGGGAEATLRDLQTNVIPALKKDFAPAQDCKLILGGYSLAGLFALWAAHASEGWQGVAAASPSVWFPGFPEVAMENPIHARAVYLSLGDREERTRNPVMAQVGDNIRFLHAQYASAPGLTTTMEWNEGNHFRDAGLRTAKAFAWVIKQIILLLYQ